MLSIAKYFPWVTSRPASAPDTLSHGQRLSLEERKQMRREMVYQSIRESLLLMEVISSMYKFKVVPLDDRHHHFMAVVDVTGGFTAKRNAIRVSFETIEQVLRERTVARYGVHLDAIYWRVNTGIESFGRGQRAGDKASTTSQPAPLAPRVGREVIGDVRNASVRLARTSPEPVSEAERKAFADALAKGTRPSARPVGADDYHSEAVPLYIGGTQYGDL